MSSRNLICDFAKLPFVIVAILLVTPVISAELPETKVDGAPIVLAGEVLSQNGTQFVLGYDEGTIIVEMDDWDSFNEASMINPGEKVTVSGLIDNQFYSGRTIEAKSVFVIGKNAKYFASPADEEGDNYVPDMNFEPELMQDGTWMGIKGMVIGIEGSRLTLDAGYSPTTKNDQVTIDTEYLAYNPLDKIGFQQISEGDNIYVSGIIDDNLFNKHELIAISITTLE